MTRLPRDLSGDELIKKLRKLGYSPTRQTGSHDRLSRDSPEGQSHLTVPRHKSLRVGTLNAIVKAVADHAETSKDDIIARLFGQDTP